jgi:hypothetical protein
MTRAFAGESPGLSAPRDHVGPGGSPEPVIGVAVSWFMGSTYLQPLGGTRAGDPGFAHGKYGPSYVVWRNPLPTGILSAKRYYQFAYAGGRSHISGKRLSPPADSGGASMSWKDSMAACRMLEAGRAAGHPSLSAETGTCTSPGTQTRLPVCVVHA